MILVICTGNICRSPAAAAILTNLCPNQSVSSAGIRPLVGHDIDENTRKAYSALGYIFPAHSAKLLDGRLIEESKIVLVMEKNHLKYVRHHWPFAAGKTFLFTHHSSGEDVLDPYRKGFAEQITAANTIIINSDLWANRLGGLQNESK